MKGSGAPGNRRRAAARSPPCTSGAHDRERSASMTIALTVLALLIEAIVGYPDRLVRAIGHPAIWIGRLIDALDRALNRAAWSDAARRMSGGLAVLMLIVSVGGIALALERGLLLLPFGLAGAAVIASSLIAQRSLHAHVAAVAAALERDGLAAGRQAVAHIVGRDPE